jgi:hypothetical protein
MKWVLWIGGGLTALIGLVALIGSMLPQRHSASRRARLRASPEAVYAVIAGPPDWRTGVKSFGVLPEQNGRKQWWEEDTHGQKITFELVEEHSPSRIVTRIADRNLPFGGTWTFDISPAPAGGSEVRVREDGEVYNVIFRFMARFFFGYTASIEQYLRDLGAKFGQAVTIEI